ncbi:hypothetical protein [Cupriavidus necator]
MRKTIFFAFIAFGDLAGLFSAAKDDCGTWAVMVGVGVLLFGRAIWGPWLALVERRGTWLRMQIRA